jgi:hypothetical protein
MDINGFTDFHAVCGDIDIPWTTEEGGYAEAAQEADKRWMEQSSAGGGTKWKSHTSKS